MVKALEVYVPHVLGFVLIAVAAVLIAALARSLLGVPTAYGGPLALVGIAGGETLRVWRQHHSDETPGRRSKER